MKTLIGMAIGVALPAFLILGLQLLGADVGFSWDEITGALCLIGVVGTVSYCFAGLAIDHAHGRREAGDG